MRAKTINIIMIALFAGTAKALQCYQNATSGLILTPATAASFPGLYTDNLTVSTAGSVCMRYDFSCAHFDFNCTLQQRRTGALTTFYMAAGKCGVAAPAQAINVHCCDSDLCNNATLPRSRSLTDADYLTCAMSDPLANDTGKEHHDRHGSMRDRHVPPGTMGTRYIKGTFSCARYRVGCDETGMEEFCGEHHKRDVMFFTAMPGDCSAWKQLEQELDDYFCCNDGDYCNASHDKDGPPPGVVVGAVLGACAAVLAVGGGAFWYHRRRRSGTGQTQMHSLP